MAQRNFNEDPKRDQGITEAILAGNAKDLKELLEKFSLGDPLLELCFEACAFTEEEEFRKKALKMIVKKLSLHQIQMRLDEPTTKPPTTPKATQRLKTLENEMTYRRFELEKDREKPLELS